MPKPLNRHSTRPIRPPRAGRRAREVRRISTTPPRSSEPVTLVPTSSVDLELKERRYQRETARKRKQRTDLMIAASVIVLVAVMLLSWRLGVRNDRDAVSATVATAAETVDRDPTPVFAAYRSMPLRLPVATESLTEIAFHQAAGSSALSMSTTLPDADMALAAAAHGTPDITTAADAGSSNVLQAQVLRLWRSGRNGEPDTAVDVGAPPGTIVYSPVSGEVVAVRTYQLYGEYEDYEIHIQPDGWPEVDCVLIHIDGVRVEVGDRVTAGVTAVAEVRLLSDRVDHQISGYTADAGDHVHVQLNRVDVPGKLEGINGS